MAFKLKNFPGMENKGILNRIKNAMTIEILRLFVIEKIHRLTAPLKTS